RDKQPLKDKLFHIDLGVLVKLCIYLHLSWTGYPGLVGQRVNHIEIIGCVAHDQRRAVREKRRARSGDAEVNTHALQKRCSISATDELTIINQLLPSANTRL